MSFDSHHSEFEQWLRQQAEQHRLYPDESVWDGIHTRVQKRRWYPWVFALLFITGGAVSWIMLDQPDLPINYVAKTNSIHTTDKHVSDQSNPSSTNSAAHTIPFRPTQKKESHQSLPFIGLNTLNGSDELVHTKDEPFEETFTSTDIKNTIARFSTPEAATRRSSLPSRPVMVNAATRRPTTESTSQPLPAQMESGHSTAAEKTVASLLPEQMQTIESVVNTYKGKRTRKSWELEFSVSPTISYRKLIENTNALQAARSQMSTVPAIAVPELNSVVNHKPDLGLQFGISVKRRLSDRLTFTGGIQFNISKYNIRAYRGVGEMATIGLNSGGGTGTVSSFTNYRSSGGAWGNWLANFYFSASAPIGFQYRIAGNRKVNWGVASTLQPSYLMSNHAYVLSTDYKNYLEVPSLIRRWNVNGQFETFVGFQTGKTRWTLGPQARYQILSSYEKAYPVQEHLFDIGVKLGVGL